MASSRPSGGAQSPAAARPAGLVWGALFDVGLALRGKIDRGQVEQPGSEGIWQIVPLLPGLPDVVAFAQLIRQLVGDQADIGSSQLVPDLRGEGQSGVVEVRRDVDLADSTSHQVLGQCRGNLGLAVPA